ncbi:MAG TPA: HNH endonuclease family protein [Enhygromyxa sp.]|nr:HNH endonuclease family protein [Enhygromyxa sp.]
MEPAVKSSLAPPSTIPAEPKHDESPLPPSSTSHREFYRPKWIDADQDCQSTRIEVLTAQATGDIEFEDERRCNVVRGRWRCPYTGEVFHDPHELDIDHLVPLKNAWDSGASAWTEERWRQFANELEQGEHLVAVSAKANRSKGARGPDEWLPPLAESRCAYMRDWAAIKARWELGASEAEAAAIESARALCEAGQIPRLPQDAKAEIQLPIPEPTPGDLVDTCCKVCRKGKACGNTCIARDKTCSVGPGCACDG